MNGQCMRARPSLGIMERSGEDRITALTACRSGASVGIIVDAKSYESRKSSFSDVELVPAFPNRIFYPMTQSLTRDGTLGPTFDDLTPEQKNIREDFQLLVPRQKSFCAFNLGCNSNFFSLSIL